MHPHPIPSLHGLAPGQSWRSSLGSLYRIYAVMSDGYVWCLRKSNGREVSRRIWCDVFTHRGWYQV